jgi:hypothetical protein
MREMTTMIGAEYDASKGITKPSETAEQVTAVVKYTATPNPITTAKAAETTHIVPVQPEARVGTVTRSPNKTPHAELLRQARAKVGQQFGGKQRQESLIISNEAEDPLALSWNGLHAVTTIELNCDDFPRAAEPQQSRCSGRHATQKTSVKFLHFEDKACVLPECAGGVSSISMGFTDTSVSSTPDSMSTAVSGELLCQPLISVVSEADDLSDCEWIALANCDHDPQCFVTDIPFTAPVLALSRQLASMERYRVMNSVNMPIHNVLYAFEQYTPSPDHYRIIADELPTMDTSNEETPNSLQAISEDGFLADSGATSSISIINNDPRSNGKYGVFMLVSKIVKPERASTFTIYGGGACALRVLGWAWHRFPMRCSLTQEVVVIVARAFVAVDPTGKYRRISLPAPWHRSASRSCMGLRRR